MGMELAEDRRDGRDARAKRIDQAEAEAKVKPRSEPLFVATPPPFDGGTSPTEVASQQ